MLLLIKQKFGNKNITNTVKRTEYRTTVGNSLGSGCKHS